MRLRGPCAFFYPTHVEVCFLKPTQSSVNIAEGQPLLFGKYDDALRSRDPCLSSMELLSISMRLRFYYFFDLFITDEIIQELVQLLNV